MRKRITAVFIAVILAVFLSSFSITSSAKTLPDGSVRVLPDHLVVLDDSGRSVSQNGEYYFIVEDMEEAVPYTKKIQIMNLREDGSYRVTFRAEPLFTKGEIDLEKECVCEIKLDDNVIYEGLITGEGTPDIRVTPLSLGVYAPGESHVMTATVTWNGTTAGATYDNGHRIVSKDGEKVARYASGVNHVSGETEFKWIFYAETDDSDTGSKSTHTGDNGDDDYKNTSSTPAGAGRSTTSSDPSGGLSAITGFVKTGGIIAIGSLLIMLAGTFIMMILLSKKKKRSKKR
ncbi:MAG: hypothetical protein IIY78_07730 [Clostridia bacterium]|nr:hypothetical protein [Clostridia bacterium]